MDRRVINTLFVNDDDLDCKKILELKDMNLASLGFVFGDLTKYDMIVYIGKLGVKVLKSKYFKPGEVIQ